MVEDGLGHETSFEYEYRSAEYEYEYEHEYEYKTLAARTLRLLRMMNYLPGRR